MTVSEPEASTTGSCETLTGTSSACSNPATQTCWPVSRVDVQSQEVPFVRARRLQSGRGQGIRCVPCCRTVARVEALSLERCR